MSRYLRDQFQFHGLSSSLRRQVQRQFEQSVGLCDNPVAVASALWQLPARECQLAGVDVINRHAANLDPDDLAQAIMALVQHRSWWDTVDLLASNALGVAFKHPETQVQFLPLYRQSPDFWMRRCALLFQLKYREQTDVELLFAIVDENLGSREFFINKAIGWALRQVAKSNRERIEYFVESRDLAALSRREGLR